jgi:uncharacterized protein (TIGR02246 family)
MSPPADDAGARSVEAAARQLYRAWHDHDEAAINALVSRDGMTEFPAAGAPLKVEGPEFVHSTLAAGVVVDVDLTDLRVDFMSPNVAVLTGYRTGVIAIGAAPRTPQRRRMTMVMVREDGKWRLAHAHFSPAS